MMKICGEKGKKQLKESVLKNSNNIRFIKKLHCPFNTTPYRVKKWGKVFKGSSLLCYALLSLEYWPSNGIALKRVIIELVSELTVE